MKTQLKPIKNFDEVIEFFGNPEEFQKRVGQYKALIDEMNTKLTIIGKHEEIESAHANIKALEANAQAQYRIAEETKGKAHTEAAAMIQQAKDGVQSIKDDAIEKERNASIHEAELAKRETTLKTKIEEDQATLQEAEALELRVAGDLSGELAKVKSLREELEKNLVKVNILLGS